MNQEEINAAIKQMLSEVRSAAIVAMHDDKNLWDADRVGQYMGGITGETVNRSYAPLPDFPAPYAFSKRNITWKASEVKAWAERYRVKRRSC